MVKNTKGKRKGNLKRKEKSRKNGNGNWNGNKKKNKLLLDKHHIDPVSRGGEKNKKNIVHVPIEKHRTYHRLFGNLTPEEIIKTLNIEFWGGRYKIIVRKEKFV